MSGLWKRQDNRPTGSRRYIELLPVVAKKVDEQRAGVVKERPEMLSVLWDHVETAAREHGWDIFKPGEEADAMLAMLAAELASVAGVTAVTADVDVVTRKDAEYGGSWKRRGGIGAFMMMCRKYDRIETQAERHGGDLFAAIRFDQRADGVLDDIADLRRYALLILAERAAVRGE